MNIICVVPLQDKSGEITANLSQSRGASLRLQIYPAMIAAKKLGHTFKAFSIRTLGDVESLLKNHKVDLLIIGKISGSNEQAIYSYSQSINSLIKRTTETGGKVCIFYSDNLLESPFTQSRILHKSILRIANYTITPTKIMAEFCSPYLSATNQSFVIEDPCTLKKQKFKTIFNQKLIRIAWFGHESNISFLIELLPDILSKLSPHLKYEIALLTSNNGITIATNFIKKIIRSTHGNFKFKLITWIPKAQPQQLEDFLGKSHISIIPSCPNNKRKKGASHNRAVDSIQSGCITIASPIESYKELNKCAIISDDIPNSLNYAIKNYNILSKSFSEERAKILKKFEPTNNITQWINFYNKSLE